MRALHVPLAPDAVEKLADRARLERRTPQEQAAVILEESLGLRSRATGETDRPAEPAAEPEQSRPGTA